MDDDGFLDKGPVSQKVEKILKGYESEMKIHISIGKKYKEKVLLLESQNEDLIQRLKTAEINVKAESTYRSKYNSLKEKLRKKILNENNFQSDKKSIERKIILKNNKNKHKRSHTMKIGELLSASKNTSSDKKKSNIKQGHSKIS